jgi:O-antigen/teichoic acid export membrane protein
MQYLSAEAFGLVGFFLMLQAWMQILDVGISPTLLREMSLYRATSIDAKTACQRLRSLECLIIIVAIISIIVFFYLKDYIANNWLKFNELSRDEVMFSITVMSIAAVLRLVTSFYRSGLIGMERQLLVNYTGVLFSSSKFIGVIPFIAFLSPRPITFFSYQAIISIFELLCFSILTYRLLPELRSNILPSKTSFLHVLPMASAIAFTSSVWIFITQLDKLILSKTLTLDEYGHFTIAVMVGSGILIMIPPLNQVIQPRMTILASKRENFDFLKLYRLTTQLVTAAFMALGCTISLFSEPLITAWTGSVAIASAAAPILFWYGLANALIGILILPFMLQFAFGYFRLHVLGNLILAITLIPMLIYSSIKYGGVGTGITLVISRFLYLILWIPIVYKRLIPNLNFSWLFNDVFLVSATIFMTLCVFYYLIPIPSNRLLSLILIGIFFLASLSVGILTGNQSRTEMIIWFKKIALIRLL